MPISGRLCLVLCLTSLMLAGRSQTPAPPRLDSGQADQAEKILAAARQALGGDAKLTAVKTFVTTGRTRQVRGENLVPIEFEILCELPDKYLRKDEVPAQESGPTSLGFNGDSLIQLPVPTPPPAPSEPARAGGPPAPNPAQLEAARKSRAMTVKQDFARLTLGMFAASFSSFPLTFSYGGQAEAPQGKADVLNVKGPGTFNVRYLINSTTHLPVMLIWQMPPSSIIVSAPGQPPPSTMAPGAVVVEGPAPPPATASQEERDKYMKDVAELRKKAQAKLVEHRLYYADYRDTDGLMFPFRIRRAIGADTTEETVFDRFRINVKIDPRRFEVPK